MSARDEAPPTALPPAASAAAPSSRDRRRARALGVLGIGLGVAPLLAPRRVARITGVDPGPATLRLLRLVGLRELAVGTAVLVRPGPAASWARVAQDAMDLPLALHALSRTRDGDRRRLALTTAALGFVTAVDGYALARTTGAVGSGGPLRLNASVTIWRPVEDVYAYWSDLENLPSFMYHLESVRTTGEGRSRWVATAPLGRTVSWEAETVQDRPNEVVAWRSLPGSDVANSGSVSFTPGPRGEGTEVRVQLTYEVPGGKVGDFLARLAGEQPRQQVQDDLRRFKQILETGEVPRSEGSPAGHVAHDQTRQRPARPVTPET